jgi:hypothetical protein
LAELVDRSHQQTRGHTSGDVATKESAALLRGALRIKTGRPDWDRTNDPYRVKISSCVIINDLRWQRHHGPSRKIKGLHVAGVTVWCDFMKGHTR